MKIRSVKYNFVMNVILTMSSIIFPLITFPYVSRVLLVEGNGKIAFASSVITYFAMFASLGIPTYGIRICAQVRDDKEKLSQTVQELLIINIITTAVVTVVFLYSLWVVPKFQEEKTLLLINGITLWLNVIGVDWLYSALEQYTYITVRSLIFKVISIALMFVFVKQKSDYITYGAINVLAASGSNILNFINLRKFVTFHHCGKYDFKQHMKPILIFFATSFATSIYTNLDTVMLGFICGDTATGYYNAATKIKTVLISIVTSLGTVLLPRLSYYVQRGEKEEFKRIIIKAFDFVLIVASSFTIYFIIYAKDSVLLLSGEAFLGAVLPMQLLMPTILFIGLTNIMGIQMLVPMGQEKKVLISIIWGAAVNIFLNIFLIPRWQASGAAFSASVTEFVVLLVQIYFLHPLLKEIVKIISIRQVIISSALGSFLLLALNKMLTFHPLFNLIISAIVFFGSYSIFLVIQKEPFTLEILLPAIKKLKRFHREKSDL